MQVFSTEVAGSKFTPIYINATPQHARILVLLFQHRFQVPVQFPQLLQLVFLHLKSERRIKERIRFERLRSGRRQSSYAKLVLQNDNLRILLDDHPLVAPLADLGVRVHPRLALGRGRALAGLVVPAGGRIDIRSPVVSVVILTSLRLHAHLAYVLRRLGKRVDVLDADARSLVALCKIHRGPERGRAT